MCRSLTEGGRRCGRRSGIPGRPIAPLIAVTPLPPRGPRPVASRQSAPGQSATRAETVVTKSAADFLDACFGVHSSSPDLSTPSARADAMRALVGRISRAWSLLTRTIERAHAARIRWSDARWEAEIAAAMSEAEARAARLTRRAREHAARELADAETDLAHARLAWGRPDWDDDMWRACEQAELDGQAAEITAKWERLRQFQARAEARPDDHRIVAEMRATEARIDCWTGTLTRARAHLDGLPDTRADAERAVSDAQMRVDEARAHWGAAMGPVTDQPRSPHVHK